MISIKKISSVTIFCSLWVLTYGQDWKEDLLAMNRTYLTSNSFQMDIVVKSYVRESDTEPLMKASGKVASADGKSCSEMMGKVTLMNRKCILLVDNKQHIMLYKGIDSLSYKPMNGFSLANLDSMVMLFGANVEATYLINNNVEKRMSFQYREGNMTRMELAINPGNNTLTELTYYYNTKLSGNVSSVEKVIIEFNDIQLNRAINDSYFSETRFVDIRAGKVEPVSKYGDYQIVNQDETQTQ